MPIDIMSAFSTEPPVLNFIWSGFLAGTVGSLVSPGATGKSFFALEAAMAVASGGAPDGDILKICPPHYGKVLYLNAEDPEPAIINRLHSIGQHLPKNAMDEIAENLTIEPIVGNRMNVMDNKVFADLAKQCENIRLLVIDTLTRFHFLEENSNGQMATLISQLEKLSTTTGAAILFVHHVNKLSTREGGAEQQQAARGASSLIDNARWCAFVAKVTDKDFTCPSNGKKDDPEIHPEALQKYMRFGVSKQNYAVVPEDRWFKRANGGVLIPCRKEEIEDDTGRTKKENGIEHNIF